MTNEEAEKILFYHRSTGNLSPMLNEALDLAISALSKQSASSEQVDKDIKFPTIHCCREYDSIQDESGRMGFGVYDPKEKNIYIAGDVPKEIFLKALFHEIFHWMQDATGMKFDENDANTFSDILYDAVDMFDDHGPELFGQKTIVEPGEVFVGENVLKKALDHQFRDSAKKTEDVPDTNVGKIEFKPEGNPGNLGGNPGIILCKDCRYRDPEDKKCDHGHGIVWQLPRPDDWFCADGKAK